MSGFARKRYKKNKINRSFCKALKYFWDQSSTRVQLEKEICDIIMYASETEYEKAWEYKKNIWDLKLTAMENEEK